MSTAQAGNIARSMPMPAIKDGNKSQKEAKQQAAATVETVAATPTPVVGEGEELHEDPETGEISIVSKTAATSDTTGTTEETEKKTAIERLISGFYFEDSPAPKESMRKPRKAGEPTTYTLRLARVHWRIGPDDYELMTSSISRQRRVWSHVEGEGAAATLKIDKQETKIVISAPGCMVGDDTWVPAITRGNNKRQADPEFVALRERVRVQWMNERRAAVKAGTIVGGVTYVQDSAALSDDDAVALGLNQLNS